MYVKWFCGALYRPTACVLQPINAVELVKARARSELFIDRSTIRSTKVWIFSFLFSFPRWSFDYYRGNPRGSHLARKSARKVSSFDLCRERENMMNTENLHRRGISRCYFCYGKKCKREGCFEITTEHPIFSGDPTLPLYVYISNDRIFSEDTIN